MAPSVRRPARAHLMGFAQLYYTSCEHGLSGYAGYQFNAATPGTAAHILREVERFTVYELPRSVPAEHTTEHPVNLCYTPDASGVTILARVISSGTDPSGRPGNYFAHSLVRAAQQGAAPVGEPLPAELWDAPFWAKTPVTDPDLPQIGDPLPSGPLDRARTAAWLAGQPTEPLARMLTAVDRAIEDGPQVVLVADSATVAHWIAALSHLLAPARTRRMSFATYSRNPDDALVHVVGVLPETGAELAGGNRFTVFDLSAGAASVGPSVPAGAVHPLASRLAAAGPVGSESLWRMAEGHASGRERTLGDWWPVVLAGAALEGGEALTGEELAAVREWLPTAARWLTAAATGGLIDRILEAEEPALGDTQIAGLHRAAELAGATGTVERLDRILALRALDGIAAGRAPGEAVPIRAESVRRAAVSRVMALLGAANRPELTLGAELLRWAGASRLAVPEDTVERYGRDVVAPIAATTEPDPVLVELLGEHAPIRRGVASQLARLPRRELTVVAAGPVGELLARDTSEPLIRELRRIGTDDGRDPRKLLFDVVQLRRDARRSGGRAPDHDIDAELLTEIWGVDHGPDAALRTVRPLRSGVAVAPDVGDWITEALAQIPSEDQDEAWRELAQELTTHWLRRAGTLPEPVPRILTEWEEYQALRKRRRGGDERSLAAHLAEVYALVEDDLPAVRTVVYREVRQFLLRARLSPKQRASALRDCPPEVFTLYCRGAGELLNDRRANTALAAALYAAARDGILTTDAPDRAEHVTESVLAPALHGWSSRQVDEVRALLPLSLRDSFGGWAKHHRGGLSERAGGLFGWISKWGSGR